MTLYRFNAARHLYEAGIHPRVLFGPEDLPKLRRQTASGPGKKILDALRPGVQKAVDEALSARNLVALQRSKDGRATSARQNAFMPAFIGLLDEDDRAIEAARRLLIASAEDGRIDPTGYDLLQPYLSPAQRRLVTRTMAADIRKRIEGRRMSYYANAAHNLTFGFALAGLWSLLAIQGDPGAGRLENERRELLRRYKATLHTIVNPDGYPEEDIGYGTSVFCSQLRLGEALRRAGLYDPYTQCPRVKNFGRAMLHFVQPWGEAVSNTGDHGSTFAGREFALPRLATETKDPTLLWLAGTLEDAYLNFQPKLAELTRPTTVTVRRNFIVQLTPFALLVLDDHAKPVHPKRAKVPTQFRDRRRGIVSLRSGWNKDDTFVVFDGSHRSPAGPGHWHDSAGHFSISALGEMFAIDTGRYNIEQSQHNVVLVDGKSGRSTKGEWRGSRHHGQLLDYAPDGLCDVVAADNSHQSDCYWSRRWLGLVKGGGANYVWTVEDTNKDDSWHEFWWQIQTCPENTITTRPTGATITGWRYGNHLDVRILLPPASEFTKPHTVTFTQDVNSTSSYRYVRNAEASAAAYDHPARMAHGPCFVRPRLIAKVAGLNGRFMSVLTPRLKGQPPAKVKQLNAAPSSFAAQVDIGPYRDVILFAYEHEQLEAGDVTGQGHWAVVRRLRASGRVIGWTLGHGTELRVAGRRLC